MQQILFFVTILCLFATTTSGSVASSIPSYTIYATCNGNLKVPADFAYHCGSYFEDTFVGVSYSNANQADVFVRTGHQLSLSATIQIDNAELHAVGHNDKFLVLGQLSGTKVYTYVLTTAGQWSQHSIIQSPTSSSAFGASNGRISLWNSTLLIGEAGAGNGGLVYVYQFVSNTWSLTSTLTNNYGSYGTLGNSVTMSGSSVAVTIGLTVFVYTYEEGIWIYQAVISGNYTEIDSSYALFPNQLYFYENLLFVDQYAYIPGGGYLRAYVLANRNGTWHQESQIQPPETNTDQFAYVFHASGDSLLMTSTNDMWEYTLGAYQVPPTVCATSYDDDDGGSFSSASLPDYTIYATCTDNMALQRERSHNDPYTFNYNTGNYFMDTFVGVYYAATEYADVYLMVNNKLTYSYSLYHAGVALTGVDQSENFLVIGGHNSSGDGTAGFVYVYVPYGQFSLSATLIPPGDGSSYFGNAIAIYNNKIVVGDQVVYGQGRVHMYEYTGSGWSFASTLISSFGNSLGAGVAMYGNEVVVSCDTGSGSGNNKLYSYTYNSGVWTYNYQINGSYTVVDAGVNYVPQRIQIHQNLMFMGQMMYIGGTNTYRAFLFANRSGVWHQESLIQTGDANNAIYSAGYTFYSSDDSLVVATCFDVWKYSLGAYKTPPTDCKVSNSGGSGSSDDLALILGIAVGVGGAFCLCAVWLCYRRYYRINTNKSGKVIPQVDGYLDGEMKKDATNKKPQTAVGPATLPQGTMYV